MGYPSISRISLVPVVFISGHVDYGATQSGYGPTQSDAGVGIGMLIGERDFLT